MRHNDHSPVRGESRGSGGVMPEDKKIVGYPCLGGNHKDCTAIRCDCECHHGAKTLEALERGERPEVMT